MPQNTPIYLDHNATTPLDSTVLERMREVSEYAFANPGSRHHAGRQARQVLEESRDSIAHHLGCRPKELIFTSGGTESINLALLGLAQVQKKKGDIALPLGEHPATTQAVAQLQKSGWTQHDIAIDSQGVYQTESIESLPWGKLNLVTTLWSHNETGVIQDLDPISQLCQQHQVPFHVDAIQYVGKQKISFQELGATALSFGAHKFNGPRGIGGLILKSNVPLHSQIVGGFQEAGRRAGTESVMLAAGMATALEQWESERKQRVATIQFLQDLLEEGLRKTCSPVIVHGEQATRLGNTLNMAFPGVDGDAMLIALDLHGVCCSLGSACASGATEPSPILLAMDVPQETALSSVRFSIGWQNTKEEIETVIATVKDVVEQLRV